MRRARREQRDVQMGPRIGESWLVAKGLKPATV